MRKDYQEARTLGAEKQMFYQIRADFKAEIEATRMQADGPSATAQTDAEYQAESDLLWRKMTGDGDAQIGQYVHSVYHEAQGVTGVLQQFNASHADSTEQTLEEKTRILGQCLIDTSRVSSMLSLSPGAAFLKYNKSIGQDNQKSLLGEFEPGDLPVVLPPYPEPDIEVNEP
jgi:hypothetical protein